MPFETLNAILDKHMLLKIEFLSSTEIVVTNMHTGANLSNDCAIVRLIRLHIPIIRKNI